MELYGIAGLCNDVPLIMALVTIGVGSKSWLGEGGTELLCYFTISIVMYQNMHTG